MDRFLNDILKIDYIATETAIRDCAEEDKKYYDPEPAIDALRKYRDGDLTFSELKWAVEEVLDYKDARKYFDLDKNSNIIQQIETLKETGIGKGYKEDFVSLTADVKFSTNAAKAEACIRTGVFFDHDLTIDHFEKFGESDCSPELKMDLNFRIVITEEDAWLEAEVINKDGRSAGRYFLSDDEIKSLHELVIQKSHEDKNFTFCLGRQYLHSIAEYADYDIKDGDNDVYEKCMTLYEYADAGHTEVIRETDIDLAHLEDFIPVGFPYKKEICRYESEREKEKTQPKKTKYELDDR